MFPARDASSWSLHAALGGELGAHWEAIQKLYSQKWRTRGRGEGGGGGGLPSSVLFWEGVSLFWEDITSSPDNQDTRLGGKDKSNFKGQDSRLEHNIPSEVCMLKDNKT